MLRPAIDERNVVAGPRQVSAQMAANRTCTHNRYSLLLHSSPFCSSIAGRASCDMHGFSVEPSENARTNHDPAFAGT